MKVWGPSVFGIVLCATPFMLAQTTIQAVVNGASYSTNLAPGSLASIFGTQLAPGPANASSVPLPLQLNGVVVTVAGVACPLSYVAPGQINFVIPFEVATGSVSVVVTASAGASPVFNVTLVRAAPGIFTQNGSGTGPALVFDANLNAAASIGSAPIVLYATGLGPTNPAGSPAAGGAASEPLNRVIDGVSVLVGDSPAQVLFAGLAPGLPGVYQVNVVPGKTISNRVAIMVNQRQSNFATLPIPVGANVTNVSGSMTSLYPTAGPGVTFSEVLFAGQFALSFDFQPGAKPFQIVARASGGADVLQEIINVDPASGAYSLTAPSPTQANRAGDFSALPHAVIDFTTGRQFPNNIIPISRMSPVAIAAAGAIPFPNSAGSFGDNGLFSGSGILPSLTHFDIADTSIATGFGGFTSIADQHGGSLTATFELFVDGLVAASRSVTFPVQ